MVIICPNPFFYEDHWIVAIMGRDTVSYTTGIFILFNVTTSLAMKHVIVVDRWNEVFSALEKPKVF